MMNQDRFPPAAHPPLHMADLLIRAGAMYSMAPDGAIYQAIAIRDEWIVAVSQDPHGLDGLISIETRVLDAPDMTILPAFEDTHNHLILAAQNMGLVPVDQAHTLAEFLDLIRQRAAQTLPGTWIQTSAAWHEVNLAEGHLPTAPELDEATREHPVVVRRGGHVVIANSLALTLGGITRETADLPGGTIVRFPDGTLPGSGEVCRSRVLLPARSEHPRTAARPEHPDTATCLNNLATLYVNQGKYEQADPLYKQALHIREYHLGLRHPDTTSSLNELAGAYCKHGKYAEAESLYQRALSIRERELGPEDPDIALILSDLALLYQDQGKYAKAEPLYQRALEICERTLGKAHPTACRIRENYAFLLRAFIDELEKS